MALVQSDTRPAVRFAERTPHARAGAIACIVLTAETPGELDRALEQVCQQPPRAPGTVCLRTIVTLDRGVVARWDATTAHLMPHGGPAVVRAILSRVRALGFEPVAEAESLCEFARGEIDARALAALARAPSPRAADVLLRQYERWGGQDPDATPDGGFADDAVLSRLLEPPLVVAMGPANIGKSSLLNALAGRTESVVADTPGTTRDPVGAMLVLDGLAVRWIDTPGLLSAGVGAGAGTQIDREAATIARSFIDRADLLVVCADAAGENDMLPEPSTGGDSIAVMTRCDRAGGETAGAAGSIRTSAATGEGLEVLARAIRTALVPDAALTDPRPWRFWASGGPRP